MIGASSEDIRLNDRFTVVEYGKEQANISAASRQQKSVIASSTQESAPSVLDGNPSTAWKANKGEYITFALVTTSRLPGKKKAKMPNLKSNSPVAEASS